MRLVRHPADVATLTTAQAWENYCNALHLSRIAVHPSNRAEMASIARQSLDRYFIRLETRLALHPPRDLHWEAWL